MKKVLKTNLMLFLFFVSAVVVLVTSVIANATMNKTFRLIEYTTQQRLLAAGKSAATLVTAEELAQLVTPEDMEKPLYAEIRQRLHEFTVESDLLFTYYMRPVPDAGRMLQFIVDGEMEPEMQDGLDSDPVAYEPAPELALQGQAAAFSIGDYSHNWDSILAAYAPVYDNNGNVVAIAGVDLSDEDIVSVWNSMRILNVVQIIALILVFVSGLLGVMLYRGKAAQSDSANIAKSQFLSRMSHEIRTPLNAIIGLSRMAADSEDQKQVKEYIDSITMSSGHLLRLINDVLDLSKIESGKVILNAIPVAVADEIEYVRQMIEPETKEKNQTFTITNHGLPGYVFCDQTYIRQILMNLLSNAVKFTPEGGEISLDIRETAVRGELCCLEWSIRDNGIGIDDKYLEKLFDPFEQGDGSSTRKYGGTGLGLAIAKQLIEMMDGKIFVRSKLGEGSEFTFNVWLKLAQKSDLQEAARQAAENQPTMDLTGKNILVVEDSEINQIIAEDVFSGMGASVDVAGNGLSGFQRYLAEPEKYDYIFMDIQMPIMDGYEATRRIRQSSTSTASSVPIIAMTANVFREDVENALEAGMNAHVGKPFDLAQVQQAILSV